MDEKALFLSFWEKEAPATRKVLSRIPEAKSDYKHEPKSRTARELAWLIVLEELFLIEVNPAAAAQKRVVTCAGTYEIDRVNWRRPELYGPLLSPNPTPFTGHHAK